MNKYEKFKADYSARKTPITEHAVVESVKEPEVLTGAPSKYDSIKAKYSKEVAHTPEINKYAALKKKYAGQKEDEEKTPREIPENEVELNVGDPEVTYNSILEDKENLKPEDVSTDKSIANAISKGQIIAGLKEKFSKENLLQFMLKPSGQHIIENALKINSDALMEHVGVSKNFNLDPNIKYPPYIQKLVEVSGAKVENMQDRLALSIFLDSLGPKGFSNIKKALDGKRGIEMAKAFKKFSSMSDNTLGEMDRLMGRAADDAPGVIKEIKTIGKIDDPILNTKAALMSADDQIIAGTVINNASNKAINVVKPVATRSDKLNKLIANSDMLNNPEKIIKPGETLLDVMPTPGQADVSYLNRGAWAVLRSPQNYAPNVYEKISLLEQRQAQIKNGFNSILKPILKVEGTQQATFAGAVADGQPVAAEILEKGLLNADGLAALKSWKQITKVAAKMRNIPEEKRVSNYLTRIWDEARVNTIPASQDLKLLVSYKSRFEKSRIGGTGYNLDLAKAARVYVHDTAKVVAKRDFHADILAEVDNIKAIDPVRGDIADIYQLNYFGEAQKGSPRAIHTMSRAVKAAFARGTIAWNLGTGMLNLTQAPIFGAAKIGYGAYARGVKMFGIMESKGGARFKKLLQDSGIFEGGTVEELQNAGAFWEKALQKLPGGKAIVKHQFNFMDWSEKINKGTVYLGAYDDIVRKMSFITSKNTRRAKRTADFLRRSGVNITGDVADEAHKYARKAVADTQIDMGRAGQNALAQNPMISVAWMYMSFPFKMAEYTLKTASTAAKHLALATIKGKPEIALNSPEVRSAMRLGINYIVLKEIEKQSGVSLRRITEVDNLVPAIGPLVQVAYRGWQAIEALRDKDGMAAEKLTKTILTLTGLPINSPAWKIRSILKTANDNKDVTGDWTVYNKRTGRPMYTTSAFQYMFGEIFGFIEPQNEADYHEAMKEQSRRYKTVRNLSNRISKVNQQLKTDTENKSLRNRKKEDQILIRKLKQEIKLNTRKQKRSVR